jgi:hypothetical protein
MRLNTHVGGSLTSDVHSARNRQEPVLVAVNVLGGAPRHGENATMASDIRGGPMGLDGALPVVGIGTTWRAARGGRRCAELCIHPPALHATGDYSVEALTSSRTLVRGLGSLELAMPRRQSRHGYIAHNHRDSFLSCPVSPPPHLRMIQPPKWPILLLKRRLMLVEN